jgi:zinc transporter 2
VFFLLNIFFLNYLLFFVKIGDLVQSIGVILAALVIKFYGEDYQIVDPICTFFFSILVLFTTLAVARDCIIILMEGSPSGIGIDVEKVKELFMELAGVVEVHDLHIWGINSNRYALSAHMVSVNPSITLREATKICRKYKIYHTTI